ncbi:hypothetical protein MKZ38_008592 [Zalerion maritima]|uniref:RNA helicase n=1 Tax=Zalerion maritima TaxID=339359 RepID=A0AAD5WY03_9PEZI|nr:hypothetical protein MKZ38_008592 [Zalerion maritima]
MATGLEPITFGRHESFPSPLQEEGAVTTAEMTAATGTGGVDPEAKTYVSSIVTNIQNPPSVVQLLTFTPSPLHRDDIATKIEMAITVDATGHTIAVMTTTTAAATPGMHAIIADPHARVTGRETGLGLRTAASNVAAMIKVAVIIAGKTLPSVDGSKTPKPEVCTPHPTPLKDTAHPHLSKLVKPKAADASTGEDEKKKRLAKLQAWKKKIEAKDRKEKEDTPGGTRKLLAEMDQKVTHSPVSATPVAPSPSPIAASPGTSAVPTPVPASPAPYQGKFDPKAIAKKAASRAQELKASPIALGSINSQAGDRASSAKIKTTPSALPKGRTNMSGFGFHKNTETEKPTAKRKLVALDDEESSKRKLAKLPAFDPAALDDTPYDNGDDADDDDGDVDNFAGTEEEAAAAARAAQERRDARIAKESADRAEAAAAQAAADAAASAAKDEAMKDALPTPTEPVPMEVDEGVDPLDAYMADLEKTADAAPQRGALKAPVNSNDQEPEAFFSDDEYDFATNGLAPDSSLLAIAAKRKKKDIPAIDYSKLDLKPIRKNFWFEPRELGEMTEAELAELRLELDGIKVKGKDVPKPVQKWSHCGLPRQTLDIVEKLGFQKPTPIQMQAIPAVMSGRDVIGVAKTGSGKTLAFLIPMFRHIGDQEPLKSDDGPIALIMTPTRELATQIHRDCRPFLKARGLRAVCAYGGAPIRDHIAELKRGAEIVVCTPGRWIDLLAANQGRVTNLKRVSYVVLDEADRMFDMGFEPQVMKIFANMRPDRQTILFSATMPRIIDALTKKVLKNPIEIEVGGRSVVAPEIAQIVEVRNENQKFIRLLELLGELYAKDDDDRTLVFVERQEKADDLLGELMKKGYPCMSIHGGKDQVDRDSVISDFKSGVVPILIATSVAARGLDVKQLKLVVNYDAPNHLEDYVHRTGRTGRAGNKGTAVTFVTEDQDNSAACIAKALEQSGNPIPEQLAEMRKAFKDKVKAGKAKDITGFGGKGLDRLDKEREAAKIMQRKAHKAEGEEEEGGEDGDKKGSGEEKSSKAANAIQSAASAIVARGTPSATTPAEPELKFGKITIHKRPDAPAATGNASGAGASNSDPLDKVAERINSINQRLGRAGQLRQGQPIDNKGPDAGAYHATLEINDFPQKARWAVTNRTNVAKILEATGTSITTKGTFYAAGKEPGPGQDAKLYILVEGDTELVVANAMAELQRLLTQGTIAAAEMESRAPISGRYTIS